MLALLRRSLPLLVLVASATLAACGGDSISAEEDAASGDAGADAASSAPDTAAPGADAQSPAVEPINVGWFEVT